MGWCWKLVRDRIGEELASRGLLVKRIEDDSLYERLLRVKVLEEALELLEGDVLEEAADILEALRSLLKLHGYTLEDALEKSRLKRLEKGGFENRLLVFLDEC